MIANKDFLPYQAAILRDHFIRKFMSTMLMKAVTAITLALIFYTIGVWSEHRAKVLKSEHLVYFWLGLCMDAAGTWVMSKIAEGHGGSMTGIHGFTGMIAMCCERMRRHCILFTDSASWYGSYGLFRL